jgi:hypothetical protein
MTSGDEDKPAVLRKLERDGRGEILAYLEGREEPELNVKVARCFPWSMQEGYVSIRDKDGKELVLLQTLDGIDPGSRKLIDQELRDKVFVPKIRRIVRYRAEFDVVYITAETDRGEVTFQIRKRDDVRVLSPGRALFRDVDGNIYEVANLHALDRASQRHIEQYF